MRGLPCLCALSTLVFYFPSAVGLGAAGIPKQVVPPSPRKRTKRTAASAPSLSSLFAPAAADAAADAAQCKAHSLSHSHSPHIPSTPEEIPSMRAVHGLPACPGMQTYLSTLGTSLVDGVRTVSSRANNNNRNAAVRDTLTELTRLLLSSKVITLVRLVS